MNNSRNHVSISQVLGDVQSNLPGIEIKQVAQAGAGLARIIANVIHTSESRADSSLVLDAISKKFDGKLVGVAGSFQSLESGRVSQIITGIVSAAREVLPAQVGLEKGFRAYASNMYLDDEDRIWQLRASQAGDLMVRTTGIDDDASLVNLLTAQASSAGLSAANRQQFAAVASGSALKVEGGCYVSYVNANQATARAFVVATTDDNRAVVLPHGAEEAEIVDMGAITVVHADAEEAPTVELSADEQVNISVASARGGVDIEMMVDYYKRVFGHNAAFFSEFESRIRQHSFA